MNISHHTNLLPTFILFIWGGSFCFGEENAVYIKDGKIVIESERIVKSLDYSEEEEKYSDYNLKKWNVKEKLDPVKEALKVFKGKSRPIYKKKIWIIDKSNGEERMIVEELLKASEESKRDMYWSQDKEEEQLGGIIEERVMDSSESLCQIFPH